MQRLASSYRAPDEQFIINIKQLVHEKQSPRKRVENINGGSVSAQDSGAGRREISRFRLSEKWIHAVPVLVFLSLFILWWFSYPVNLVIKDGRITAIHRIEIPLPVNNNHFDLTILASATQPSASVSQNLISFNRTESHPVSRAY
ncbi:uncharacterized protein LOC131148971 [Malania oleifera]|uniref:uncharacterized protein LOC131148971 n=1 Tax=Malania oleifera TaxID=397392 RepID=UPI0025AE6533|nr:uncharacterized protein LOC131148971 [Malania oleifera]